EGFNPRFSQAGEALRSLLRFLPGSDSGLQELFFRASLSLLRQFQINGSDNSLFNALFHFSHDTRVEVKKPLEERQTLSWIGRRIDFGKHSLLAVVEGLQPRRGRIRLVGVPEALQQGDAFTAQRGDRFCLRGGSLTGLPLAFQPGNLGL